MNVIASIDVGSTFTKGALFRVEEKMLSVEKTASVPTTTKRLADGFREVYTILRSCSSSDDIPVRFSSSAKGGLHIVAVGIVPALTTSMAKMTALSAGAKVTCVFAHKLNRDKRKKIEKLNPDIILFAGGTEGGNEVYNVHNCDELAQLNIDPVIIYAGNSAVREEVEHALREKKLITAENILPELDNPSPENAREKIREVFLDSIVKGKGLQEIVDLTGTKPVPTPSAVLRFARAVPQVRPDWDNFCIVDVGGATTDFYSSLKTADLTGPGVVRRGLPEPKVKRTVEGDLGIRWSAVSTVEAGRKYLEQQFSSQKLGQLTQYCEGLTHDHSHLPESDEELEFDRVLSSLSVFFAGTRHAGSLRTVYTPTGPSSVQRGRDLRKIKKIIGTGGFLSKNEIRLGMFLNLNGQDEENGDGSPEIKLLPDSEFVDYFRDADYLLPLLGNVVQEFPSQAVNTGINGLRKGSLLGKSILKKRGG